MKLLYDLYYAQPLNGSKFHGGGEYMKAVFKHLAITTDSNLCIEVFYNPDSFLDEWIKEIISDYGVVSHHVKSHAEIISLIRSNKWDVFYTGMPYQYSDNSLPPNIRKIGTIHGLRAAEKPVDHYSPLYLSGIEKAKSYFRLLFPRYFSRRAVLYYKKTLSRFDEIITDSLHSQLAIRLLLNTNKTINVFYAPAKELENSEIDESCKEIGSFILLIGGNRWEKNTARALLAIENMYQTGFLSDVKTVVCGKLPLAVSRKLTKSNYIFYDFVSSAALEGLYKQCRVFLYPTLNEGFGLPPLEAMKYGKTCVVSCVCSLPELCSDSVYYINPYDLLEIQNRVMRALLDPVDPQKVINQYMRIKKKQISDLEEMSRYITGTIT